MIFICTGSQKFQFDRLLEAVDTLAGSGTITEKIFAQSGYCTYRPEHFEYKPFLDRNEFAQKLDEADIVITHGGTGVIISAVKKRKKVIAVPRRAEYGEHVDDHQLQLLGQFKELDLICECDDPALLAEAIETVKHREYKAYVSNTRRMMDSIAEFIEG
ncbi:MAG: PssE/Cps14G family polysaccharide biosynthesis glycosyltransferase [Eubacteriales bacterium]|nr:PssE/Cps14G family polysaccharide biosynthesis glycosyltransferase [Eubacteriales bacterium]